MDIYQERYEEHIQNKLKRKYNKVDYTTKEITTLLKILENRKSVRKYNYNNIDNGLIDFIVNKALNVAPSSCNRKGIYYKIIEPEVAEQLLVGGKKWVDKSKKVIFLYGAKQCYKNPKEISYMPYLDAGFVAQNIYLLCEVFNIGCCFINPNITKELNSEDYFVGAISFGDYDV